MVHRRVPWASRPPGAFGREVSVVKPARINTNFIISSLLLFSFSNGSFAKLWLIMLLRFSIAATILESIILITLTSRSLNLSLHRKCSVLQMNRRLNMSFNQLNLIMNSYIHQICRSLSLSLSLHQLDLIVRRFIHQKSSVLNHQFSRSLNITRTKSRASDF